MNGLKGIAVLCTLTLAACASGGRCVGEFEYQKAQTLPPLHDAADVKAPQSSSSLRIPAQPVQVTAYAEHVADPEKPGKRKVMCLDTPPVMPALASAPAAAPPAQPAPVAPAPEPAAEVPAPAEPAAAPGTEAAPAAEAPASTTP